MSSGITNKCFPPANKCFNCFRKGHDTRPARVGDTGNEYKRCTGCRLMTYCDQDCQREHWLRIHKHHCRFLEGRRRVKNNEHNSWTCSLCVENRDSSSEEISSLNYSKMHCYVQDEIDCMKSGIAETFGFHSEGKTCSCPSTFSWPGQLPFSFGEASGHYIGEGRDEMIAHTLKLAVVIKMKAKDKIFKEEITDLILRINQGRVNTWCNILVLGKVLKMVVNEAMDNAIESLKKYLGASNPWWIALRFSLGVFQNIEIRSGLLAKIETDFIEKCEDDQRFTTLKQVLKDDESKYKNIVFASGNSLLSEFKVWPQLVESSLVLLLPSGLHCQNCKDKVEGQFSLEGEESLQNGYPLWFPSIGENGSCEVYCSIRKNPNCVIEGLTKNVRHGMELNEDQCKAYTNELILFNKLSRYCDECGKRSLFSHRCSACHASQYCSTQCQMEDLEFHKSVCSKWAKDEARTLGSAKEQKKFWKSVADKLQN